MDTISFNEMFNSTEAKQAQKSLDYLDGVQLQHVIEMLDNTNYGRRQWKERGMRPQYRNVTGMVIQKSAMLWDQTPPIMEVWNGDSSDETHSQHLNDLLNSVNFTEFMMNFDEVVRLLKTAVILQQFDELNARMTFDILHKGNCHIHCDPITKQILELVYMIEDGYENDEEFHYYRIYTTEYIQDWKQSERPDSKPELISQEDNPYGFVPASQFHDTNLPRTGFWNKQSMDLVRFNDMYNLHLVDMEFAASWTIHQTLFTNAELEGGIGSDMVVSDVYKSVVPRQTSGGSGVPGGLGSIVTLDTTGVENPFVEYKGPDVDLMIPVKMFQQWSRDFASDWGVNIKFAGEGSADSGFQLIVESMDNLDLRTKRQRFMENGLERMYLILRDVMNMHFNAMPPDSYLKVSFAPPHLPVDKKQQEEVWSMRISQGRATPIDYYMEVYGMTKEEAEAKWTEIQEFNQVNDVVINTDININV